MKIIRLFNFTEVAGPGCEISNLFLKEIIKLKDFIIII